MFFQDQQLGLSEGLSGIGELKTLVANLMRANGFTAVVVTAAEVAGNRGAVRVTVLHLPVTDTRYWQVVIAAGDTVQETQSTCNDLGHRIQHDLHPL